MHNIGWNYRATEMQCALGRSQLSLLNRSLNIREKIAKKYEKALNNIEGITLPTNNKNERHIIIYILLQLISIN